MQIRIADIPPEGRTFEGEEPPGILDLPDQPDASAPSDEERNVRIDGPVHYRLSAQVVSGSLIMQGRLSVPVSFRCSRCNEFFSRTVTEPSFSCVRDLRDESGAGEGHPPVDSECIDLTEDIRESTILNFPSFPVCRADCKGLCAQCGRNLNRETCDCKPPQDTRWSGLDGLNIN